MGLNIETIFNVSNLCWGYFLTLIFNISIRLFRISEINESFIRNEVCISINELFALRETIFDLSRIISCVWDETHEREDVEILELC